MVAFPLRRKINGIPTPVDDERFSFERDDLVWILAVRDTFDGDDRAGDELVREIILGDIVPTIFNPIGVFDDFDVA